MNDNLNLHGIPVGALIVLSKNLLSIVIDALRELQWIKKSNNNVTCYDDDINDDITLLNGNGKRSIHNDDHNQSMKMAVHLNSDGARVIQQWNITTSHLSSSSNDGDSSSEPPGIDSITHKDSAIKLFNLILKSQILWKYGLRVNSKQCQRTKDSATKRTRLLNNHHQDSTTSTSSSFESSSTSESTFKFVELFAGIGGFRVGLEALGGQCVFASEIAQAVRDTYVANFKQPQEQEDDSEEEHLLCGDITEVEASDVPNHDILTAGFPCQSFCKVGDLTGLDDTRGELFFEVVRVLNEKKPKAFLLENVANLLTIDEGATFNIIRQHLQAIGYHVSHKVIDAAHFVPQSRQRVYIVGFLSSDHANTFTWPTLPPITKTIRDILEYPINSPPPTSLILTPSHIKTIQGSFTYKKNPVYRLARCDSQARTLMSSYKTGFKLYSEFLPVSIPPPGEPVETTMEKMLQTLKEDGSDSSSSGLKLRFYSPRECARLMGFPDSFLVDKCRHVNTFYHQIGNAVCPPVIEAIGRQILLALTTISA